MFTYETKIRVRYAETDQMGFVYYGNYATYYEVARVEALRSLGLTYKKLEESGVLMPVVENRSKYIRPAKYDDLLTVRLKIPALMKKRITFEYEIYNERGKLIHTGSTTLTYIDAKTGRTCEAPDMLTDLFKPYYDSDPQG